MLTPQGTPPRRPASTSVWVAISFSLLALAGALVAIWAVVRNDGDGGDDFVQQITPTPTATATLPPTFAPSPTPAPTDTAEPTPTVCPDGGLDLSRAACYLDASAVLPGFRQLDPQADGLSNADVGVEGEFSETVVYLSEEPLQTTSMFMTIASGETEKAVLLAELMDEQFLEELMQAGLLAEPDSEEMSLSVAWGESDVGDMAEIARCSIVSPGLPDQDFDFLLFYQDAGPDAAIVIILSMWERGGEPVVDIETIGQEVSSRIG